MSFNPRRLSSPNELRALAHPLRLDILEQLMLHGAMTASDLGEALGETPANCSWHLRKLAEHGFVEEAGDGQGRRRPWRATQIGLTWNDEEGEAASPGYRAASEAMTALFVDREVARWRRNTAGSERNWADLGMSETVALLTEEEAKAFSAELEELVLRHHGRLTGEDPVPDGARRVHVLALTSVDPQ
ncbi:MAG: winged helix-turn-helix domain-containing protein [Intrasporangium sp.]|uniref:winged helix-turn-helix domain-containing protein n=1 Tax=Intrasporangium sp. TaxID=1925024 RepID=UPI003F801C6C